jgi:hypothetical protein
MKHGDIVKVTKAFIEKNPEFNFSERTVLTVKEFDNVSETVTLEMKVMTDKFILESRAVVLTQDDAELLEVVKKEIA